ncbi:MAG: cytochrome c oxidase subunit 4, partial [Ilumatobacteraceae bacterium]|jgi:cytochrome c oxidase subunit 1
MNLTFGPMHIVGLQGQPRRMYVWTENRAGEGFFNIGFWNLIASIGSLVLSLGVLLFLINIYVSHRKGTQPAPLDPWDARSLEWMTASPPKEHNFDAIPTVGHLDEFFHRKYEDRGTEDHHDYHQVATAEDLLAEQEANAEKHIHLPSPSYWPILLAFALPIMAYGVIYNILLIAAGALLALVSLYGWGMEPHTATDDDYDPPTTGTDLEVASHG